jgi:hypothetical protein
MIIMAVVTLVVDAGVEEAVVKIILGTVIAKLRNLH